MRGHTCATGRNTRGLSSTSFAPSDPILALLFGEALLHASQGDEAAARASLRAAIDRQPLLRAEAEREPLLAPLLDGLG